MKEILSEMRTELDHATHVPRTHREIQRASIAKLDIKLCSAEHSPTKECPRKRYSQPLCATCSAYK